MITFTHNQVSCNLHFPVSHRMFILLCTEWTLTETKWNQSQSAVWREFSILQYWLRLVCRRPYSLLIYIPLNDGYSSSWNACSTNYAFYIRVAWHSDNYVGDHGTRHILMLTCLNQSFFLWFAHRYTSTKHCYGPATVLNTCNWYFPNGKFYHVSCPFQYETPSKSFF